MDNDLQEDGRVDRQDHDCHRQQQFPEEGSGPKGNGIHIPDKQEPAGRTDREVEENSQQGYPASLIPGFCHSGFPPSRFGLS